MNDRELLEAAAKVMGYRTDHPMNAERLALTPPVAALWVCDQGGNLKHTAWNPLVQGETALRLAVTLGMTVDVQLEDRRTHVVTDRGECFTGPHNDDAQAATRRAIVVAAASLAN